MGGVTFVVPSRVNVTMPVGVTSRRLRGARPGALAANCVSVAVNEMLLPLVDGFGAEVSASVVVACSTVKTTGFDVPPGRGLKTVTPAVPTVARSNARLLKAHDTIANTSCLTCRTFVIYSNWKVTAKVTWNK